MKNNTEISTNKELDELRQRLISMGVLPAGYSHLTNIDLQYMLGETDLTKLDLSYEHYETVIENGERLIREIEADRITPDLANARLQYHKYKLIVNIAEDTADRHVFEKRVCGLRRQGCPDTGISAVPCKARSLKSCPLTPEVFTSGVNDYLSA